VAFAAPSPSPHSGPPFFGCSVKAASAPEGLGLYGAVGKRHVDRFCFLPSQVGSILALRSLKSVCLVHTSIRSRNIANSTVQTDHIVVVDESRITPAIIFHRQHSKTQCIEKKYVPPFFSTQSSSYQTPRPLPCCLR